MGTSEKVNVPCPQCKASLAVPATAMGKSGRCPHCGNVFPLAMPAQRPTAAAAMPQAASYAPQPAAYAPQPAYNDMGLAPLGAGDLMPLGSAGMTPSPALAPMGAGNPFNDPGLQSEYALAPVAAAPYQPQPYQSSPYPSSTLPSMTSQYMANANAAYDEQKTQTHYYNNPTATGDGDGWGINAGIGGGALMMLIAVVWFFAALFLIDRIFIYPPIMFVIGLIAFIKGIADNFGE